MNTVLKKRLKTVFWPLVLLRRLHDAILCRYNPEKLFCIRFKRIYGVPLNSRNPKTLYDRIAYLAFHTDTTLWSRLADKIAVRDYIKEKGYGHMLPQLYGVYDRAEDIDYKILPSAFVLKTNNASATNILVRDKTKIDINAINKRLNRWLRINYGRRTCQPHYSRICPRILCEELLVDNDIKELSNIIISNNIEDKFLRKQHMKDVCIKINNNRDLENNMICPKCGSELVERNSKYGKFIGCSNYPKCKYIKK